MSEYDDETEGKKYKFDLKPQLLLCFQYECGKWQGGGTEDGF